VSLLKDAVLETTVRVLGQEVSGPSIKAASGGSNPLLSGHGIYVGQVLHQRFGPQDHAFRYPLFYVAVDLDGLPELSKSLGPFFGYNRPGLLSIWDKDYLRGEGSLRQRLDVFLETRDLKAQVQRVTLLTVPRYLGYVFNPVSFYYCFREDGSLAAAVSEVNNTFGERHLYLLDHPRETGDAFQARYTVPKDFHVSPFYDRSGDYDFRFAALDQTLDIQLDIVKDGSRVFLSRLWGSRRNLNRAQIVRTLAAYPLSAALTMPRILWQAVRLRYQKKLPVYTKPYSDSVMTIQAEAPGIWRTWQRDIVFKFFRGLKRGTLTLTLPDRSVVCFGGQEPGTDAVVTVGNWTFFRRIISSGDIGFGESYQEGEWTSPDVVAVLRVLGDNLAEADDRGISFARLGRVLNRWRHASNANTPSGSRRNIQAHYDLSNEMYEKFLDPSLVYSCALFLDPTRADQEELKAAQTRKLRSLLEPLKLQTGQHLLEIGSGWGALAILAARDYGVRVTSLTLSEEQLKEAQARAAAAGFADRITFEIRDYRDISETYDAIVSCEMLEAVGHENYGTYFKVLEKALKPGGRASIQVITLPDHRYEVYRQGVDWIQKHIFPGAVCPSLAALAEAWSRHSHLGLESHRDIGLHYAPTLRRWREAFLARAPEIRALGAGFDDKFIRTWEYYFAYCEAGFSQRLLGNLQLVLARAGESLR
jgi:cyclopropane-fatty-acyl-phospholipid synthase